MRFILGDNLHGLRRIYVTSKVDSRKVLLSCKAVPPPRRQVCRTVMPPTPHCDQAPTWDPPTLPSLTRWSISVP
jgi:hypothetical protein